MDFKSLKKMAGDVARTGLSDQLIDIVDDDASVRRALKRLLSSVGLRCDCYSSAGAYFGSGDLQSAACLLLDIHLPEMSGIELLEQLRDVAPDLPVICMTGRAEPEIMRRLATLGHLRCLRKPFDESELFAALSEVAAVSVSGFDG